MSHISSIDRIARWGISALAAFALLWLAPNNADATKIERLITPAGIEVWLVRDPTVPLVAINFGFSGGSAQDPSDKGGTANMMVRIGEIRRYDDLREFANQVYQGNLVLLDFSPIANDEIVLRRVTGDLKKLAQDINGDIAGWGKFYIVCPTGVRVDRHKNKGAGSR